MMMFKSQRFVVQIKSVEWEDCTTFDGHNEVEGMRLAMAEMDRLLEESEPGRYDGRLRIIKRVTTEEVVGRVRGTLVG